MSEEKAFPAQTVLATYFFLNFLNEKYGCGTRLKGFLLRHLINKTVMRVPSKRVPQLFVFKQDYLEKTNARGLSEH